MREKGETGICSIHDLLKILGTLRKEEKDRVIAEALRVYEARKRGIRYLLKIWETLPNEDKDKAIDEVLRSIESYDENKLEKI